MDSNNRDDNSNRLARLARLAVLTHPTGHTYTPSLSNRAPFKNDEII